ncbi:hypothetical protein R2601_02793 [Salipiger bermudensis HTCC2601]|uniref:Uncharacterized protein n=1 Tax=Salipiger bermudensis (strain DSM 26914 / JCM 13377 / KCTC 12554 / HTCC2601) TaxID=314265 RepID=Q0FWT7_SALBH|nr:hypothetical protein R2601_02793 [Salipiger bermudensis HTCC2601]
MARGSVSSTSSFSSIIWCSPSDQLRSS